MSTNAYIAWNNIADTATLLASSQPIFLPISNIQNPHIARKWRGQNGVTDSFVADLGSLQQMDTLAVFGITGLQIRIRLSSIDSTGLAGDIYDGGTIAVDQNYLSSICILPSVVSARFIRVDLTTTGTFVEAGRLFAGVRTVFPHNFSAGWQRTWTDLSLRSKTRGGQTQVFPDNVFRTYDVTFDFLLQADRDGFVESIDRINGMKTDLLFIGNPDSTNLSRDSIWGMVTALSPVVQPYVTSFTKQYTIEERL